MGNCKRAIAPLLILVMLSIASVPCNTQVQATNVIAISAGTFHSAAVCDDGTVWTWGDNRWGQLGDGTNVTRLSPVQVPISDVKAISAGFDSTVALKNDGTAWAWGDNHYGQLGDGTNKNSYVPIQVKGLSHVKAIAAGGGHVLALKEDGTVWAWGRGFRGQLGIDGVNPTRDNNDTYSLYTPTQVPISNVIAISAGAFHTAALKADGSVWSWGEGSDGVIGNGDIGDQYTPVQVSISDVKGITCGHSNTLALKNDGTIWGWGLNLNYCLGNVTIDMRQTTPVKARGISDAVAIAAGDMHTLALKGDGTVWAWGYNQNGRLGYGRDHGPNKMEPVQVKGLTDIIMISAGSEHSLALRNDGTVWAWGRNMEGQLGDGEMLADLDSGVIGEPEPVQVYVGTQTGPAHVHASTLVSPSPASSEPYANVAIAPINASAKVTEKWSLQNLGRLDYLSPGDDGLLYAFSDNTITCLGQDGVPRWNITIPDKWRICRDWGRTIFLEMNSGMGLMVLSQPIYAADGGTLYVYATPNTPLLDIKNRPFNLSGVDTSGLSWDVLAIALDGRISWDLPLKEDLSIEDATSIKALDGKVYVFHDHNETVLDKNGSVLFTISNVSDPAAIDEYGCLYTSEALRVNWSLNNPEDAGYDGLRVASGKINAYDASGKLSWQKDAGGIIPVQYMVEEIRPVYGTVPLYHDGIVYVPISNGIMALDRNGNELWSKRFDFDGFRLFELMPVDVEDNVYLACYNLTYPTINEATDIYMIDRNGTLVVPPRTLKICYDGARHSSAKDGIVYNIEMNWDAIGRSTGMDDIATATIRAYDIKGDRYLWNYTLPTDPRYSAVLDASNVYTLFDRPTADLYVEGGIGQSNAAAPRIIGATWVDTYPMDDTLYINFKSVRHEWPVILGESQCMYTSGICALDTSGFVVCQKPVGSVVTAMTVNNSTVYYGTGDGGISAMTVGLVAGVIAITAALALLVGYIARSRSRLDKNDNRNSVMGYIAQHPGSTLYEISRGMGMNKGTVRYHLFILSVNHRIVSYNDGKFVRYFTNSGTFSKEERILISLIRRDTMKNVLRALLEKPGITSADMGKALGQPDSAVRKHLNELCAKGIVLRENISDSRYAYSIKAEYLERIESLMKSLSGENASITPITCPAEA